MVAYDLFNQPVSEIDPYAHVDFAALIADFPSGNGYEYFRKATVLMNTLAAEFKNVKGDYTAKQKVIKPYLIKIVEVDYPKMAAFFRYLDDDTDDDMTFYKLAYPATLEDKEKGYYHTQLHRFISYFDGTTVPTHQLIPLWRFLEIEGIDNYEDYVEFMVNDDSWM